MRCTVFLAVLPLGNAIRIIQSNDDGWAEINIRTLFNTLTAAGNQVVLSAPASDQSGSGSSDSAPTTVGSSGCEFSSCPANSPATGSNSSDARLNYVNSYPVTAIKTGISTTAPKLWSGAKPELAVTGPNVGSNVGIQVPFSGTVGAATYAAHTAGIPAIAFSGRTGSPTAWNAQTPLYSKVYADLALNVTTTLVKSGTPYLPADVWLNVNLPTVSSSKCSSAAAIRFVLTRINSGLLSAPDASWCGSTRLPVESDVYGQDACIATISIGDASDKTTADATKQAAVIPKLKSVLTCL